MCSNKLVDHNADFSSTNSKNKNLKKRIYLPTIFATLFGLIVLAILISWIVYWANGSNSVGSLHPLGILEIFTAPIEGFISSVAIIVFLLMLGGFMKVMTSTQALQALIGNIYKKMQGKEIWLLVTIFILFAICGTVFGVWSMAALPFYFILIPLFTTAGFDKFTTFLVICFGAEIGALASTINPILINTAFDAANSGIGQIFPDSELISTSAGLSWRIISFVVLTSFVLGFIVWYALRIKKDQTKMIIFKQKAVNHSNFKLGMEIIPPLTKRRKLSLFCFFMTFIVLIIFSIPWDLLAGTNIFEMLGILLSEFFPYIAGQHVNDGIIQSNIANLGAWSLIEMAFLFFVAAFSIGCINWKSEKDFGSKMINGASSMLTIILIISLANGFNILLTESGMEIFLINTINEISQVNQVVFVIILYLLFFVISIFIPSMSGFAKTVFPTVGPALYGSTAGVSVSGAILTFSFANGLVHLMLPVSAPLIFGLEQTNVSFKKFYRLAWFLIAGIVLISLSLLMIGTILPPGWF